MAVCAQAQTPSALGWPEARSSMEFIWTPNAGVKSVQISGTVQSLSTRLPSAFPVVDGRTADALGHAQAEPPRWASCIQKRLYGQRIMCELQAACEKAAICNSWVVTSPSSPPLSDGRLHGKDGSIVVACTLMATAGQDHDPQDAISVRQSQSSPMLLSEL